MPGMNADRVQGIDASLFEKIDRYLLRALLTPEQERSMDRHGWFDVHWREQWLVVRVHTDRLPTVEAFQPPPRRIVEAMLPHLRSRRHRPGGRIWPSDVLLTRLGTWDVRGAMESASKGPTIHFVSLSCSPLSLARRVLEAYRRGALAALLETASCTA